MKSPFSLFLFWAFILQIKCELLSKNSVNDISNNYGNSTIIDKKFDEFVELIDEENPLLTHWEDEELMRKRLEKIAKEKLGKNKTYVLLQDDNSSVNEDKYGNVNKDEDTKKDFDGNYKIKPRDKRDLGLLSSPIATAVVTGMIGMSAKVVSDLTAFRSPPSQGGCEWFGTAPFCTAPCPSEYDYVRKHNGRCSNFWLANTCRPDESFGEPCSTLLGSFFKKRFCCKSDPNECAWSGRWMGANTAHNAYCRYDNNVGRCGSIVCSINHHDYKAIDRNEIAGENCDQLNLFNMTGYATCGFIAWNDVEGNTVNSWYKTR